MIVVGGYTTYMGIHSHSSQRYADTRAVAAHRSFKAILASAKFFRSFSWS
jgi:hypothetical protein